MVKLKGVLLDFDNTLYEYLPPHNKALNAIFEYCQKKFGVGIEETLTAYNIARKKVHIDLQETAASHNRLLYIQKMLEILQLNPIKYGLELYNSYWDTFLNEIKLFDGVSEFITKYKGKICIVSDLTAHIQFRKMQILNLDEYINFIVTSEEVGREKPHPYTFMTALKKLDLMPQDVCMIGDSFKKDIIGATNLGIQSIWVNNEQTDEYYDINLVTEVRSFNKILELI
jgi:HAD superfamily hydrolase (TIGR01549 family)